MPVKVDGEAQGANDSATAKHLMNRPSNHETERSKPVSATSSAQNWLLGQDRESVQDETLGGVDDSKIDVYVHESLL